MGLKEKEIEQKKGLAQLLTLSSHVLVIIFLTVKMILIKDNLKKILCCYLNFKVESLIEFPIKAKV
jgi:hypothetical protein